MGGAGSTVLLAAPANGGAGGGIYVNNTSTTTIRSSIIAGNSAVSGPDVFGTVSSLGFNLIGETDGSTGFNRPTDLTGTSSSPLNPKLGPLANNGGPTLTQALPPGSPAIDKGDDSVLLPPLSLTTDQRGPGFPRKVGLHVDIGAFELLVYDTCLKDNSSGNLFQWNSISGQYKFTRCSDGFTLTGTGVVKVVNDIQTLTDSESDRRVSAGRNLGQMTGTVTIYFEYGLGVWETFVINDTNPGAVCACSG